MAGIKEATNSVLSQLQTILDLKTVRVYNNDFKALEAGKCEIFALPAALVEIVSIENMLPVGAGFSSSDLTVRIHVGHEYYNQDGTLNQDLTIFDLKDKIVRKLSGWAGVGCSSFQRVGESQNFEHDNVYVYMVDFSTHFIDSAGSDFDPSAGVYAEFTPAEIVVQVDDTISLIN